MASEDDEHDDFGFDHGAITPIEIPLRVTADLKTLLVEVLAELRKLSHPAFEAKLLDEIRKQLNRQQETSADLKSELRDLHHDLQWLRKHIGALNTQLARLGVEHAEEEGKGNT